MNNLQRYRIKTHEELLASEFAMTPGGTYIHPTASPLTPDMLAQASMFSDALVQVFFAGPLERMCHRIDGVLFSTEHFIAEPLLSVVKE